MKNKFLHVCVIAVFLLFIFSLTIINLFSPNVTFSENENRVLASFPSLTLSNIFSGNFDDEFESWFTDHFISRDTWIQAKALTRIASGSIENNDVYIAGDNRLIGSFTSVNETTIDNNISYINDFSEEINKQVNVMIVPGAAYGEAQYLPSGSYNLDEKAMIDDIQSKLSNQNIIDVTDPLVGENNYFKTDHHWNEKGAYIGYEAICSTVLNKEPETFTYTKVADNFCGTMYSKSGVFWNEGDPIYRIDGNTDNKITLTAEDGTILDSLYNEERLQQKDKYTYYIDGNHAYEKIQTSIANDRKAVIIKDSYSHILIPYLAQEYSEIELVDLRYYRDGVSKLIEDPSSTDVYIIYSLDTFASDKNLAALW